MARIDQKGVIYTVQTLEKYIDRLQNIPAPRQDYHPLLLSKANLGLIVGHSPEEIEADILVAKFLNTKISDLLPQIEEGDR